MSQPTPILFSFRRCPYAMRARLALAAAHVRCELREVVLRDKPPELIAASPKATVPVMILPSGEILEESLDIMMWAKMGEMNNRTRSNDIDLPTHELVIQNDGDFKHHLDRYKYPHRYAGAVSEEHRKHAEVFLTRLDQCLEDSPFLDGDQVTDLDYAIAPFVRQFANTDRTWFDRAPYPHLQRWLKTILTSPLFLAIMTKYPQWSAGDAITYFHFIRGPQ